MSDKWVFVRGLGRGQGHWGLFRRLVLDSIGAENVEFLDLKGNGQRYDEISFTSISDFMEDLRFYSRLLKEGQKVNLVALSLGGMVCAEWAHQYPDEVASLTMVSSSSAESPFYHRFNLRSVPLLFKGAIGTMREREKCILEVVANSAQRRDEEFADFVEYSTKYPLKISNFFRQIKAASGYRMPSKMRVSIKLIGSYGDRLVSPACTIHLAKLWNLEPVMHSWGGHDLGVDDPRWLFEQLPHKRKLK